MESTNEDQPSESERLVDLNQSTEPSRKQRNATVGYRIVKAIRKELSKDAALQSNSLQICVAIVDSSQTSASTNRNMGYYFTYGELGGVWGATSASHLLRLTDYATAKRFALNNPAPTLHSSRSASSASSPTPVLYESDEDTGGGLGPLELDDSVASPRPSDDSSSSNPRKRRSSVMEQPRNQAGRFGAAGETKKDLQSQLSEKLQSVGINLSLRRGKVLDGGVDDPEAVESERVFCFWPAGVEFKKRVNQTKEDLLKIRDEFDAWHNTRTIFAALLLHYGVPLTAAGNTSEQEDAHYASVTSWWPDRLHPKFGRREWLKRAKMQELIDRHRMQQDQCLQPQASATAPSAATNQQGHVAPAIPALDAQSMDAS